MKSIPAPLQAHYDSRSLQTAHALRVTREDGQVFAFTSHDERALIGGVWYEPSGLDVTNLVSNPGLAVDNMELVALNDGSLFTREAVVGGLWQNAAFLIFRYSWSDVSRGIEPLVAGTVGNVDLRPGRVVVELRGLQQYLQQPVGAASSKTCRARLGDSLCRVDMTAYTHAGTVTAVADDQNFTDSALAQAADYFGEGIVRWVSGANAGMRQKVKTHPGAGAIQLALPMPAPIQVGDTFTIEAGCRKRVKLDCNDKFNNVLNFQGEPHRPVVDDLTAPPSSGV